MSKRSIRKIRHYKPALSFKQRVHMGMIKKAFGSAPPAEASAQIETIKAEHEHGEHCDHDGAFTE